MAFQSSQIRKRERKRDPFIQTMHQNNLVSSCESLSAQCIMEIAKTRLLQIPSQLERVSTLQSSLSDENLNDIKLALNLLKAAQNISFQQFDYAEKLLDQCLNSASSLNNPIKRVVSMFVKALKERIDKEMGRIDIERNIVDKEEYFFNNITPLVACGLKLPFNRVTKFAGIQAVLDHLGSATRIHFIDLRIRSGSTCIILMQGLSNRKECKLDLLKITAVGTSIYELESNELVAMYSGIILHSLLSPLDNLKSFVGFVKKVLKPCVMVITEIEANTNTDIFMHRFHEVVNLTTALFDCFEACFDDDCFVYREVFEEAFFMHVIKNNIVEDNEERSYCKYARVEFWREFLGGFGIEESELSQLCLCQTNLMLKTRKSWSGCTLDTNGKCIVLKWHGTPIESLSVWKFQH